MGLFLIRTIRTATEALNFKPADARMRAMLVPDASTKGRSGTTPVNQLRA